MTGPKIIGIADEPKALPRETGIRKRGSVWVAIVNGRAVGTFTGPGCKASAIQAAGTNRVLA